MKFEQIIESLLDTDLYKFGMNQVIFRKHNDLCGDYLFKCRNKGVKFTKEMLDEINEQLDCLCKLRFADDEIDYLKSIRFLKRGYIEFLRYWYPRREYANVSLGENGELNVLISGPIFSVMQFEIYLLEIICEVYYRMTYDYDWQLAIAKDKLDEKIKKFNDSTYSFSFTDFGGRRRFGREWHRYVIEKFLTETKGVLNGTSNVYLAKLYGIKPMGTYAHEYVQMFQGIPDIPLAYSNKYAMQDWYDVYQGDNGIALTDTITTDAFLLDFGRANANNYTGVRHDSGDPFAWGDKMIEHYKSLGIDPTTKLLLFSDSLDFDKAQRLYNYFNKKVKVGFGIGTFVTNDCGVEPLNIVIKLQRVNGNPVAKLSDVDGKTMSIDDNYVKQLKEAIDFRISREKM